MGTRDFPSAHSDAKRAWKYARAKRRSSKHRLAVDVERQWRLGFDRHLPQPGQTAADDAIDGAVEQPRQRPDRLQPRALLEHHEIQLTVVDARAPPDDR